MFIFLFEPMYLYQYVKGIMLLTLLIVLKVKVNIQYMSIKHLGKKNHRNKQHFIFNHCIFAVIFYIIL